MNALVNFLHDKRNSQLTDGAKSPISSEVFVWRDGRAVKGSRL